MVGLVIRGTQISLLHTTNLTRLPEKVAKARELVGSSAASDCSS